MKKLAAVLLAALIMIAACGCTSVETVKENALTALEEADLDTVGECLATLDERGATDELTSLLDTMVESSKYILAVPSTYAYGVELLELAGEYTDLSHLLAFKKSPVTGVSNWAYFWGNYIVEQIQTEAFSDAVESALYVSLPDAADMKELRAATEAVLADEPTRVLMLELINAAASDGDKAYFTAVSTYYSMAADAIFGKTELGELGLWADVWFNTMVAAVNDAVTFQDAANYAYSHVVAASGAAEDIDTDVLDFLRSCCFLSFEG